MEVRSYDDISEFYSLVTPFLLKHEAENNLLLGILDAIKDEPFRFGGVVPVLNSIFDGNKLKLIALRTPPKNQLFSYTDDVKSIDYLVESLKKKSIELPGVLGFKEGAEKFAKLWCRGKKLKAKLAMNERIYKLESVAKETLGKRKFTIADISFTDLVINWGIEFIKEAFTEDELKTYDYKTSFQRSVEEERIYFLFENDKPVSMARRAGKTPNGITVNLVYTPPLLRRKGYATECVAKLSKLLLEEGNKFCFLFTDLMNPTSNSIYQKIGYKPIIDMDQYEFIPMS
jgi:GNAT superfamily N-acetyltransferase